MIDFLGQVMKIIFDIVCNNWLDEGSRFECNFDIDIEEQELLMYLYEVVLKLNVFGIVIEMKIVFYIGGVIFLKMNINELILCGRCCKIFLIKLKQIK